MRIEDLGELISARRTIEELSKTVSRLEYLLADARKELAALRKEKVDRRVEIEGQQSFID